MITEMKKYTFLVFHKEYTDFLTTLREAGVVHVSEKAAGTAADEHVQALLARKKEVEQLLSLGAPEQLLQEKANIEQAIADSKRHKQDVALWGDFSTEKLRLLEEAGYKMRFFMCADKYFDPSFGTVVASRGSAIYFAAIENWMPYEDMVDVCNEIKLDKSIRDIEHDIEAQNGLLAAANARIEAWQLANIESLKKEKAEIEEQIDWRKVVLNTESMGEGALMLLEGYCPTDKADALNRILDEANIYYQAVDPIPTDNTPIQLKNNRFAKLFEVLTGMYGWPTYGEFDPTPILAPFYLLFFAMCMGDAGYGILLLIIGILIAKGKLKISMFDGLGPIMAVLGAGTIVVGLILGTFFGIPLKEATWYPDALKPFIVSGTVAGYDAQMVLAVGIGVFHICFAMVVKALCYTKRFGFRESVSVWGWLLLIVGSLSTIILSMALTLPIEVTKWTLIAIATVSAMGIYIFNTPGRNPLINIGAGLWETYNMATGILGDVLSYVRLYALGLAGGMLGKAFNDLATMPAGGSMEGATWQWLPFLIIVLLGHTLNLLMSGLGAFVHPLRLTFVEYFKNSGYEGKGTLYRPFEKKNK